MRCRDESAGFKKDKDILGWCWTDFFDTYSRRKGRANTGNQKLAEKKYAKKILWEKIYDAGQRLYVKKPFSNEAKEP